MYVKCIQARMCDSLRWPCLSHLGIAAVEGLEFGHQINGFSLVGSLLNQRYLCKDIFI